MKHLQKANPPWGGIASATAVANRRPTVGCASNLTPFEILVVLNEHLAEEMRHGRPQLSPKQKRCRRRVRLSPTQERLLRIFSERVQNGAV